MASTPTRSKISLTGGDATNAGETLPCGPGDPLRVAAKRRIIFGAAALLLFTVVTRFVGLGGHELWFDEVCSYRGATDTSGMLWRWLPFSNDEHSPLPFIEMKASLAVLGDSQWALRFPAACYAVLGVLALYGVVGRSIGWAVAWWAALLLALNPYVLEHHREARMYPAWFFYATVAVGVAWECTRRAEAQPNRRSVYLWWLALGMIFMLMFAQTTHAILTIVGIFGWGGALALHHWHHHRRAEAWAILRGGALTLLVFCVNWSTIGLKKMFGSMVAMSEHDGGLLPNFTDATTMAAELTGYLPRAVGWLPWLLAIAGLVVLARRGHTRYALLIVVAGAASLIGFCSIVSRHFYSSRYMFIILLTWSIGLAVVLAALWSEQGWRGRSAVVAILLALSAGWLPVWRVMYTVPKNPVAEVIATARTHAKPGDALMVLPTQISIFTDYYPTGHAREVPPGPLIGDMDPARLQPAIWIFAESPGHRIHDIATVMRWYGLNVDEQLPDIQRLVKGRPYCTMRISARGVDPIAVSRLGRPYNCHIITLEK